MLWHQNKAFLYVYKRPTLFNKWMKTDGKTISSFAKANGYKPTSKGTR